MNILHMIYTIHINELLTETKFGITNDIVEHIFQNIKAETQEELNIKSALMKQSFLNAFDLSFETEFLNASEKLKSV
jgi:hypothetical protein